MIGIREYVALSVMVAAFVGGIVCRGWYDEAVIGGLRSDVKAYENAALILNAVATEARRVASVAQEQASAARAAIKPARVAATCDDAVDQLYEAAK